MYDSFFDPKPEDGGAADKFDDRALSGVEPQDEDSGDDITSDGQCCRKCNYVPGFVLQRCIANPTLLASTWDCSVMSCSHALHRATTAQGAQNVFTIAEDAAAEEEELGSEDDLRSSDEEWGGELYDTGEGRDAAANGEQNSATQFFTIDTCE